MKRGHAVPESSRCCRLRLCASLCCPTGASLQHSTFPSLSVLLQSQLALMASPDFDSTVYDGADGVGGGGGVVVVAQQQQLLEVQQQPQLEGGMGERDLHALPGRRAHRLRNVPVPVVRRVPVEECPFLVFGCRGCLHREGDDLTVVTWGAMVHTAAEAAEGFDDLSVEVIDLRSVLPWDKEAVLASVRKTSKVLVLHEDTRTGGFGAEIAATIADEAFEDLDAPVKRIAAPDTPVPFSPPLEKAFIPQVEDVVKGLRELAEY